MARKVKANATGASQGGARNATSMYGGKGALNRAYTSGANRAVKQGRTGMAVHRAGLSHAGLS
jgi:hypothetical protein